MKSKLALFALFAAAILPASATVTLNTAFGTAYNAAGTAVPNGTLWALVVDTNNDSSFLGQFGTNSSLNVSGADILFNTGDSIGIGDVLGGDTVFAMGGFNADGSSLDTVIATLGANGLAAGLKFSFLWFPGVIYTVEGDYTVGLEVGGIHSNINAGPPSNLGDMVIPSDGALVNVGAGTADGAGGTLTPDQFKAVLLVIPEPSTALLGAIGALGLLRRRR